MRWAVVPLFVSLAATAAASSTLVIRHARVFDGHTVTGRADRAVVVRDGRILRVIPDARLSVPTGAKVIDAHGGTILPGFIDAHVHIYQYAQLEQALALGVTTDMDMLSNIATTRKLRDDERAGRLPNAAHLFTAGYALTAPGGHGTEYGFAVPTVTRPEEAPAFVAARFREGSDYLKIIMDDGRSLGLHFNTISARTLAAAVKAAHARHKLVFVHVQDEHAARAALDGGADFLAHVFIDRRVDPRFVRDAKRRGLGMVATLTVMESITGGPGPRAIPKDPYLSPYLQEAPAAGFGRAWPKTLMDNAKFNVRALFRAGVPVAAGTDSTNPGTFHGASLHREMELLTQAGLTPLQALAAATSVPAKMFHFADRGRIAPGLRADLVVVNGNPAQNIRDTRRIIAVVKDGRVIDRSIARRDAARVQTALRQDAAVKPAAIPGIDKTISDFETGGLKPNWGLEWTASTDKIAGGQSDAGIQVVADGANHALEVTGTARAGAPYPWAGAMWMPGPTAFAPADLSARPVLVFRAKGDGRSYRVLAFSKAAGFVPLTTSFTAGGQWATVRIPFSSFQPPTAGKDIEAFVFCTQAAPTPNFRLLLDDVRLEK